LKTWFEAKDATAKRLIMAGALLVVAALTFGAACFDLLGGLPFALAVTCDKEGAVGLISNFILALVANQATFLISPPPSTTLRAKKVHPVGTGEDALD
jgi:hypothetical protein